VFIEVVQDCYYEVEYIAPSMDHHFEKFSLSNDIYGQASTKIYFAPEIFARMAINKLKEQKVIKDDLVFIHQAMKKAAYIFINNKIHGLSLEEYIQKVCKHNGSSYVANEKSTRRIYQTLLNAHVYFNAGAPSSHIKKNLSSSNLEVFTTSYRRGDILGVIAPGNGIGVHCIWLQALSAGYKVVLRPSEKEPFTLDRLVRALVAAGLENYVAMIPTEHHTIPSIIDNCDLNLFYGTKEVLEPYQERANVLTQGPGHSSIIIGSDFETEKSYQLIYKSMTELNGTSCKCATHVYLEDYNLKFVQEFVTYIKTKFISDKERNRLHRMEKNKFSKLKNELEKKEISMVGLPSYVEIEKNVIQYSPLVYVTFDPQQSVKIDTPLCAIVFSQLDLKNLIKDTSEALIVTIATKNQNIINNTEKSESIKNIYLGNIPTTFFDLSLPHDDYLYSFLMKSRGYINKDIINDTQ
tara:strand:+ start:6803 stop:8197 length:1395 start_codon:yes stop_codon:yes gene_type:complete